MDVNGFVKSRMRESRTSGSVRGKYREVLVYSIAALERYKHEFRKNRCLKDP